jgi:hypothetical protein
MMAVAAVLVPFGGLASVQSIAALPVRATRGYGARLPFVEYEAESGKTKHYSAGQESEKQ